MSQRDTSPKVNQRKVINIRDSLLSGKLGASKPPGTVSTTFSGFNPILFQKAVFEQKMPIF